VFFSHSNSAGTMLVSAKFQTSEQGQKNSTGRPQNNYYTH